MKLRFKPKLKLKSRTGIHPAIKRITFTPATPPPLRRGQKLKGTVYLVCGPDVNEYTPQIGVKIDQPNSVVQVYVAWERVHGKVRAGTRGTVQDDAQGFSEFIPSTLKLKGRK